MGVGIPPRSICQWSYWNKNKPLLRTLLDVQEPVLITMAPCADHEGHLGRDAIHATTVVIVGAGPSGLMLA